MARAADPGAMTRLRQAAVATLLLLAGCVQPAQRVERMAAAHDLRRDVVQGTVFRHVVLRNSHPLEHDTLRVYLEGDGVPFATPSHIAADPTSRSLLVLRLFALDGAAAVYVGRPCYLGLAAEPPCIADDWTRARFSPAVVASLAQVVRDEMRRAGAGSVQLVGHSGGGSLAVLLTRELSGVTAIVTIGANLDTDAWAALHRYTPLRGSLDPLGVTLPGQLAERSEHLVGSDDTVIPAAMLRAAARRIGGSVHEYPGFSHQCCWESVWPSILAGL
jgi:hypothetical protein